MCRGRPRCAAAASARSFAMTAKQLCNDCHVHASLPMARVQHSQSRCPAMRYVGFTSAKSLACVLVDLSAPTTPCMPPSAPLASPRCYSSWAGSSRATRSA